MLLAYSSFHADMTLRRKDAAFVFSLGALRSDGGFAEECDRDAKRCLSAIVLFEKARHLNGSDDRY
jgi:hypothetical protein